MYALSYPCSCFASLPLCYKIHHLFNKNITMLRLMKLISNHNKVNESNKWIMPFIPFHCLRIIWSVAQQFGSKEKLPYIVYGKRRGKNDEERTDNQSMKIPTCTHNNTNHAGYRYPYLHICSCYLLVRHLKFIHLHSIS